MTAFFLFVWSCTALSCGYQQLKQPPFDTQQECNEHGLTISHFNAKYRPLDGVWFECRELSLER